MNNTVERKSKRRDGRRPDGEGSLYSITRKYSLKDGSTREKIYWVGDISWTDPDGTPRRETVQRVTKSEAREALKRLRLRLAMDGTTARPEERALTVAAALERWLTDKAGAIRPSTRCVYEAARRHLEPLHAHRVASLTRDDIKSWIDQRDLSSRMKIVMRMILRAALRPYVRLIREDIFPRGTAPRIEPKPLNIWTPEQACAFLSHTRASRLGLLWRLGLHTGMRRGEMLGLRWRDVHDGWIEVSGSLDVRTRTVEATKTKGSRRRVDIDPGLNADLQQRSGASGDFIFATAGGKPLSPRNVLRDFRAAIRAVNKAESTKSNGITIPEIRLHDLRHFHATALLRENVHPKIVSERLGHASIRLTLDTYSKSIPTMQTAAAAIMASILGESPKNRRSNS